MKISISLLFLVVIATFAGCKQDFDPTSKYEEVPVVYGLLNAQDSTHYIRIQKGYLMKGNAYLAAGITDSIYYPDNLIVKLLSGAEVLDLHRVVINFNPADPLSKDTGQFANDPNILYQLNKSLDINKEYVLQVLDTSSGKIITSRTRMVQDFSIGFPVYGAKLTFSSANPTRISWVIANNGSIYDLTVRFHYIEHRISNNTTIDSFVDVPLLRSYIPSAVTGTDLRADLSMDNLFRTLASNLKKTDEVEREFDFKKGMQFKFAVGGDSLTQYISSRIAQGGITSGEALPSYTNINGGQGIFSSRYFKQVDSVILTNSSLDSLACNPITRPLRFRKHDGNICN